MQDKSLSYKIFLGLSVLLSLALIYYHLFLGVLALIVIVGLVIYSYRLDISQKAEWTNYLETLSITMDKSTKAAIQKMPIPLCMVRGDGYITWYNKEFSTMVGRTALIGTEIESIFTSLNMERMLENKEQSKCYLNYGENRYEVIYYNVNPDKAKADSTIMLYFMDLTEMEELKKELSTSRVVCMMIKVDSYYDILESASISERPLVEYEIEIQIQQWMDKYNAALVKMDEDEYAAFVTEVELSDMEQDKFTILDNVRNIEKGNTLSPTLTIGVAPFEETLFNTQTIARGAMDLGLGRGGDQAVVKRRERLTYYGGRTKAIEKRTKVRARVIAYALRELIQDAPNVLIMGHAYPDMDALGAAMGLYGICAMFDKEVNVVLEKPNDMIYDLYSNIVSYPQYQEVFVHRDQSYKLVRPGTLLIVVDTHSAHATEYPRLLDICEKVVVIDHHRRGDSFIEHATLVYHETYVSSASEMVTELIQYVDDKPSISSVIAEALLAGITLDTRFFMLKTGVRTFEAAAFLRRSGADTMSVKQYFKGDVPSYLQKSVIIQNAVQIHDIFSISFFDKETENPRLLAAQSADELLNIRNVEASFVAVMDESEDVCYVSARSLSDVNVQIIMEKLGGGGHFDTAAAQIRGVRLRQVLEDIQNAINEYVKENLS